MKGVVESYSAVNTSQPARGEVRAAPVQRAKGVIPSSAASQSYQNWEAAKQYTRKATAEFEKDNVKVGNGEYMSRTDYAALSDADKSIVNQSGVSGLNTEKQTEWNNTHVQLTSTKEWISKDYYQSLSAEDQTFLSVNGTDAWNKRVEHRKELEASIPAKYKTDSGYNITQMLYDGAISAYKDGVDPEVVKELFGDTVAGKVDVDSALLTSTLLATLHGQGYADAQGNVYTDKLIADRGVQAYDDLKKYLGFTEAELGTRENAIAATQKTAATPQTLTQGELNSILVKVDNPRYKNADDSYNLVTIQYDEVLSPHEQMLVFGQTQEGRDSLKSALAISSVKKSKAIEKEFASSSYLRAKKASQIGKIYLGIVVPGYYTKTHWSKMATWEKVLSVGLDAVALLPVLGAAGKGAQEAAAVTRSARLAAAGRAATSELIRQVAWPAEMVKSIQGLGRETMIVGEDSSRLVSGLRAVPANTRVAARAVIQTQKDLLSGIENVVRIKKLPSSVVVNTMHSAKLPVSVVGSGEETMALRDAIMTSRVKDVTEVAIAAKDTKYTLHNVALMEKTGGLAHGAQDVKAFDVGLVVKEIPTKSALEQGLFAAPNPIGRYALGSAAQAGKAAEGAKSGIIICSKEFAEKFAASSHKLYAGTAEIESIFKVGTKMEKPAQKLFTRIGGERIEIYLATKLSAADILELKAKGLLESVKNLYTPTLEISGSGVKGLTEKQISDLADTLYNVDRSVAENLRRVSDAARLYPNELPSAALRLARSKASMVTVSTTVRGERVKVSRTVTPVRAQLGESIDSAIRRTVSERNATAEARGYTEVTRATSARADAEIARIMAEDAARASSVRADVPRLPAIAVRTPATRIISSTPRAEVVRANVDTFRAMTARGEIPKKGRIPIPWLPNFKGTRKQAKLILESSITWRQGKLHDKDIWIVLYPPYQQAVYLFARPKGVREIAGPKSAYRTAVVLKSSLHNAVQLDIGAFIAKIEPSGVGKAKLSFVRDTGLVPAPEGTVVWQQGELHGKPVYVVVRPPYQQENVLMTMQKPLGATEVPAPHNAATFHGKLGSEPLIRVGAFRVRISKGRTKSKPRLAFYRGDQSEVSASR